MLTKPGDDNWDDDFASSISPSALHLPQFKPHDNFGGMLSSDRLKAFASFDISNEENEDNWDSNFEGDLMTIKAPQKSADPDSLELETIRPYRVKPTVITQNLKPAGQPKNTARKASYSAPPRAKTPAKVQTEAKFVLPSRPANIYREQSVEDYSDLFVDNDSVFNRRLNIVKVSYSFVRYNIRKLTLSKIRMMPSRRNYFTLRISHVLRSHLWSMGMEVLGEIPYPGLISRTLLCGDPDPLWRYSAMQRVKMTKISRIFLATTMPALLRGMIVIEAQRMALELSCYIPSSRITRGLVTRMMKTIPLHH
jgi:hypothetical protein